MRAAMEWITHADLIVLTIAAYIAVMTLVRLMKERRDVVVADVQNQIKAHQRAKKQQRESDNENRAAA
jgi:predicted dinucleotide-binding enzyme